MSFMNIKEISENNKSQEVRKNEEIHHDLLYKRPTNTIHEENYDNTKEHIESSISLRNCLIFLEYLYLFLKENPDKISSSYIIKIDISLLLDILQRKSKRMINSNEFFYLNLIELKDYLLK